jgi:hypothetical protein
MRRLLIGVMGLLIPAVVPRKLRQWLVSCHN